MLLIEEAVREEIQRFALPVVAWNVLEMLQDPEVSIASITAELEKDQALTAAVLKLANSPLFSLQRQVSSLKEATVLIGLRRLGSIVLSSAVSSLFRHSLAGYRMPRLRLWQHSLVIASGMRLLGTLTGQRNEGELYAAGLLHDLGMLVLDRPLSRIRQRPPLITVEIEQELLGIDHAAAGALLLESWKLPKPLEEAARYHHAPHQAQRHADLCAMVHYIDTLAHNVGLGPLEGKQPVLVPQVERLLPFQDSLIRALPELGQGVFHAAV